MEQEASPAGSGWRATVGATLLHPHFNMKEMRWIGLLLGLMTGGSCFRVLGPHYAKQGTAALLTCDHGVPGDLLHKVDWLKGGLKFFQYVKGRTPPFRNYSTNGATVDWEGSSDRTVLLKNLGPAASGHYSCEVATDTPIYTMSSDIHQLLVIQNQMEEPRISFGRPVYTVGDLVKANCTSGRATPTPTVTWLIDGQQAEGSLVKVYKALGKSGQAELRLRLEPHHVPRVRLTCLSTIPGHPTYADRRTYTITVDVVGSPKPEVQKSLRSGAGASVASLLILIGAVFH